MTYGDAHAHDVLCGRCGSLLYSVVRDHRYAHVTLGTLIDPPSIRPRAHIFVGSRAPWDEISDDLPQHAEGRERPPLRGARASRRKPNPQPPCRPPRPVSFRAITA